MKIIIVGKGLAGSLAVSHLCKYLPGHEIEWVCDPNIDTQSVGEGSILTLTRSLFDIFGFSLFSDLSKIFLNTAIGGKALSLLTSEA